MLERHMLVIVSASAAKSMLGFECLLSLDSAVDAGPEFLYVHAYVTFQTLVFEK